MAAEPFVPLAAIEDQPQAVEVLRRALASDRVAHAYAFVGPAGSGRATTAVGFAAALLCSGGGESGSDRGWAEKDAGRLRPHHCRHCALVASRQHPDLHVIVPTPPPKNPKGTPMIRIDDVRRLGHDAALKPLMARRKVFIVDDAHRMTDDTPEAFLKTLEEPPDRTVMILVLPRVRALPATVLSRCQIVRFRARPSARLAADMAEALGLLAEVRAKGVDALFRRAQSVDRARAEALVDASWHLLRDLLLVKCGAPAALLVTAGRGGEIAREAEAWGVDDIVAAIAACREARRALVNNVSPRLTVEVVVSRLLAGAA